MANDIPTGEIRPNTILSREDLFFNIESATTDIEAAVGIIESLGKTD